MDSNVSCIEEIPRKALTVPQIRLKIIHLNLDDRGRSLTPPPPTAGESSLVQSYTRHQLLRKRLHKLNSYGHLLRDQGLERQDGDVASSPCPPENDLCDTDSKSEVNNNDLSYEEDSVFTFFVKGMNNYLSADRDKILNAIVQLLNKHTVSVATKEHLLFGNRTPLPPKSTFNHILVKSTLLLMNELVDQDVLDISQRSIVQLGQCLTFSLYFHKNLQQLGRSAWHSSYAQVMRDAWMSFGCLGAVLIISSMRQ
nr:uncharacterized protein LOC123767347 [Procambarus clarkii]XP_045612934.1 uncharacterized protein LOC123767347 [Procambarus clarkii]